MNALNPDVNVVKYQTRIDASNIMEIIEGYDVIVDGVDNFPTRYLLNDATVRLDIPVVSASILGFDGQLSVFAPHEGPCYRCLYPTPPPAELAPSCGANGATGANVTPAAVDPPPIGPFFTFALFHAALRSGFLFSVGRRMALMPSTARPPRFT